MQPAGTVMGILSTLRYRCVGHMSSSVCKELRRDNLRLCCYKYKSAGGVNHLPAAVVLPCDHASHTGVNAAIIHCRLLCVRVLVLSA